MSAKLIFPLILAQDKKMMQVSSDFAPPFKLIAPYFIIGTLSFLLSCIYILNIDINNISFLNPAVLSFVHLFLLGFVMMIIFGAMAQLIPVTLEIGHFSIEFYYIIYPLLAFGTILMTLGFYYPNLLPFGGTLVLISMLIFICEFFLTIKKVKEFNIIIKTLVYANIFLAFGIIIGLALALTYSGLIITDIYALLKAHVFLLVVGYICLTIMALSLVLLPMFALSHNYSQKPLHISVYTLCVAVTAFVISSLLEILYLDYLAYVLTIISLLMFFYQSFLIYKTRARKQNDIYVKSLFFAFYSLLISIVIGIIYLFTNNESYLLASMFLIFFGFFAFLIIAHLYKIVPFLVWFEKFAPLVGKQKVPLLKDMVPNKSSIFQFYFTSIGIIICTIALIFANAIVFKAGASFLIIGSFYLFFNLIYMIRFK